LNRRTIASWCLYDFANSFYAALPVIWGPFYQRIIVGNEEGLGDLWWGYVISTTMLTVAISSPMMGAVADYAGIRKRLLMVYTLVCVGAVCLFPSIRPGMVLEGFLITVISYVAFEGGLVFYNAYLPEIAPRDYQGRVSGWGFAVGYVGSLLGLLLCLFFFRVAEFPAGAWLSIAAAFLLFSIPAFLWLPADQPPRLGVRRAALGGIEESWRTFRDILKLRETRRFLLAYFFYEDGVNTVINFASAFAAQTMAFSFVELPMLFAVVQISALLGAYLWAKPTDRLGPKRVVLLMLVQWSLVAVAAYFVQTKQQFWVIAVLAGTGLGAIQAASRAFMSTLVPRGREADFFGFYSLCGKSAAVMGPLIFGGVSRAAGGDQRLAILSVMVLFVVGAVLLVRVRAGGPTHLAAPAEAEPAK
jgi:UMF1 family MFS transporter